MKLKRIIVAGTITALLIGLAGTGTALVWMHEKVRALQQERAQLEQKVKEAGSAASERQVAAKARSAKKRHAKARPAKAVPAKVQPAKANEQFVEFVARDGEDLISIAIEFGLSPSKLMSVNGWNDTVEGRPGMVFKIPANLAKKSSRYGGQADARDVTAVTNAASAALSVVNASHDGETTLRIRLSRRPDMEVLRHYVSVEPLQEGRLSFEYEADYNHRTDMYEPVVIVKGDTPTART